MKIITKNSLIELVYNRSLSYNKYKFKFVNLQRPYGRDAHTTHTHTGASKRCCTPCASEATRVCGLQLLVYGALSYLVAVGELVVVAVDIDAAVAFACCHRLA